MECDRCLDMVDMPIDTHISLSVKFGDEESSDAPEEGEREVIFIPEDDAELDLGQIIYDYVCLSLPMQRVHADGQCNPAALKHLSTGVGEAEPEVQDSPFAALKDLLK